MQRIFIGASLRHIAAVFKSDWRMFIAICWLPLVLMWLLKLGINNFTPDPKILILHSRYKFEIIVNIHMALRVMLTSVMLVGVYRYLLNDPRFNLKSVQPQIWKIPRRIRSIPFYFTIDKSTLALAGLFIVGAGLFRLVDQILVIVFFDQTRSRLGQNLTLWIIWMQAPMQVWRFLYFAIATQLCLIFPYISTSRVITRQKIWQNIITLKDNRFNVFAVRFIIELCFVLIWIVPVLIHYLIFRESFLNIIKGSGIRYFWQIAGMPLWFLWLLLSTIFCAESFRLLGCSDQENRTKQYRFSSFSQ